VARFEMMSLPIRVPASGRVLVALTLAGMLAACSANPYRAGSLPPSPTQPVQTTQLPPPGTGDPQTIGDTGVVDGTAGTLDPNAPQDQNGAVDAAGQTTVAALPESSFGPARVDDMSGGWTITDSGGSCPLFMSTTAWTGGYRAVTRGCASVALQKVNAWNVEAGRIVLKDDQGAEIARLNRVAETQFQGVSTAGSAISFSR